jgi:hypothetical protein
MKVGSNRIILGGVKKASNIYAMEIDSPPSEDEARHLKLIGNIFNNLRKFWDHIKIECEDSGYALDTLSIEMQDDIEAFFKANTVSFDFELSGDSEKWEEDINSSEDKIEGLVVSIGDMLLNDITWADYNFGLDGVMPGFSIWFY